VRRRRRPITIDDPRRQLDFWLGDWDCAWEGGHGRNRVVAECDGRVIREAFDGSADGLIGASISLYDERAGCWRQSWGDSLGGWFDLRGGARDGGFELHTEADAEGSVKRMRFDQIEPDSFRWTWSRSADGGWEPLWTIRYTRDG
jgi:hypothetical protein